jgi:hypothetical protein
MPETEFEKVTSGYTVIRGELGAVQRGCELDVDAEKIA